MVLFLTPMAFAMHMTKMLSFSKSNHLASPGTWPRICKTLHLSLFSLDSSGVTSLAPSAYLNTNSWNTFNVLLTSYTNSWSDKTDVSCKTWRASMVPSTISLPSSPKAIPTSPPSPTLLPVSNATSLPIATLHPLCSLTSSGGKCAPRMNPSHSLSFHQAHYWTDTSMLMLAHPGVLA